MAIRRERRLAILNKIETVYGTDSAPTAADALIGRNVTYTPFEGEEVSRDLLLPYLGNQGVKLAGIYARLEFDIEIAGAGAAGTVPKYGSVLRVCGLSETVTADTDVTYNIIEDDQEASSIYFVLDKVQHVMLGCRGNVSLSFTPKGIPYYRFTVMGLLGTITDVSAMPVVTKAGWIDPLVVSKAASSMVLHGWTAVAESLSLDLGNTVTPRFLIGDESMPITDRSGSGTAVVEAKSLATIDWFDISQARTKGALSMVHGITAGNIVEARASGVEIGRPTQGQTNNIVNYSLPLLLTPDQGLDELEIVVR